MLSNGHDVALDSGQIVHGSGKLWDNATVDWSVIPQTMDIMEAHDTHARREAWLWWPCASALGCCSCTTDFLSGCATGIATAIGLTVALLLGMPLLASREKKEAEKEAEKEADIAMETGT